MMISSNTKEWLGVAANISFIAIMILILGFLLQFISEYWLRSDVPLWVCCVCGSVSVAIIPKKLKIYIWILFIVAALATWLISFTR